MQELHRADSYLRAAESSRPGIIPAVKELLHLDVCPRCCLRYAGVRSDIYAQPAPTARELRLAAERLSLVNGNTSDTGACASAQQPALESSDETAKGGKVHREALDARVAAASADQSLELTDAPMPHGGEPPCKACLGILQSLDGPLEPASAELMAQLPETDGGGSAWMQVPAGDAASIAAHIRQLDYSYKGFAAEISTPASTQLRQLALWYHLRAQPSTKHLYQGTALQDDVVDLKECLRLKWTLGEPLAEHLGQCQTPEGDLRITINYIHPSTASESDFLFGRPGGARSQNRKKKRKVINVGKSATDHVSNTAARWALDTFRQECAIPPSKVAERVHVLVACRKLPVYIGGLYRKLDRTISQSPWMIDGERRGTTSVQEEIERIVLPALRAETAKFITAGREDMDVRMLGMGRPFVLEIPNARASMPSRECFAELQQKLADAGVGVEVKKLQPVGKDKLQLIKEGEQHKQKSYEAICWLPCGVTPEIIARINNTKDLVLAQHTPTRVAHRRALLTRERTIYSMRCQPVPGDSHKCILHLRTQAGTYIKEFVHGDDNRTQPHLGSFLGCSEAARILQLDVLDVHMDFLD